MAWARRMFKTYGPYLGQPYLWPEIYRRVIGPQMARIMPGDSTPPPDAAQRERLKDEASAWCAERAITADALLDLFQVAEQHRQFDRRFADELDAAKQRAAACPVPMGGASHMPLIHALCEHLAANRVIETGVAFGWSSLAALLSLSGRPAARLYSVDLPYFDRRNDPWVGCAVPAELHKQWLLYRMADRDGLPRAIRAAGTLDLAHYDSDKSPAGRAWAYPVLWAALRRGGILISDDVGDNNAFQAFAAVCGARPHIVQSDGKFLGILSKI